MKGRRKIWAGFWWIISILIFVPVLCVALAAAVLYMPPLQRRAIAVAERILCEKTGMEVSVRRVSLTPLVNVDLRGILMLDADQDTLLSASDIILMTDIHAITDGVAGVKRLSLRNVEGDSKDKFPGLRLRGNVGRLDLVSDSTSFFGTYTYVNELFVKGVDLTMDLYKDDSKEVVDSTVLKDGGGFSWMFDVREASVEDTRLSINPIDIDISVSRLKLSAMVDIGNKGYHARHLEFGPASVGIDGKRYSLDEACVAASMDSTLVRADSVRLRKGGLSAYASAMLDLDDIKAISYSADVDMDWMPLSEIIPFDIPVIAKGKFSVNGQGFDINDRCTAIDVKAHIDSCCVPSVNIGKTELDAVLEGGTVSGSISTRAQYADSSATASVSGGMLFRASDIASEHPSIFLNADMDDITAVRDSIFLNLDTLMLNFDTRVNHTGFEATTEGVSLNLKSPEHLLDILSSLTRTAALVKEQVDSVDVDADALKKFFPELEAEVSVAGDNPARKIISLYGASFDSLRLGVSLSPRHGIRAALETKEITLDTLSVHSADISLTQSGGDVLCRADVDFRSQHGLPDITAGLDATLSSHSANARLEVVSDIRNGILNVNDLNTGLNLELMATLDHKSLQAEGKLILDSLKYASADFGRRTVKFGGSSPDAKHFSLFADTDDIPLSVVGSFVNLGDIAVGGDIDAKVRAAGTLDSLKISGEVCPDDVYVGYAPLEARFSLGSVPIRLEDGVVRVKKFPIYADDGTSVLLDGSLDLNDMYLDFSARSDRFRPLSLERRDSIPFFGTVAAGMDVALRGRTDSLVVSGDVTMLPETEITYLIDHANYVYARPSGKVNVKFPIGGDILLDGRIDVKEGQIMYSPKFYPLEPFTVDPGSFVAFNGPLKTMDLNISATQPVRAIVGNTGDRTREVDFIAGVKVMNSLDSLGLSFILDAPKDEEIKKEIKGFSPEERDRTALALLTTGMYVSETNTAMNQSGYAVTSVLQHSANALVSNKLGKFVNLDFGVGSSTRDGVASVDYSMTVSKSFFDDRLRVNVGGRVSDVGNSGKNTQSAIDNLSLDWKVKKDSKTVLTLFHKKDYENIVDGELDKDGIGVRAGFEFISAKNPTNPFLLDIEGNVSYRSNAQLGPDLSATVSKSNLLNLDETFSAKLFGAYYWKTANRASGDASANDNFDLGFETSASFKNIILPGLVKKSFDMPVSTTFNLGYMYENIASGCILNKIFLDANYGFRTSRYISHDFTPLSWTLVLTAGNQNYYSKITSIDHLYKTVGDNTNTLAIKYNFRYNNSFETSRDITTRFDAGVMESGILFNSFIKSKPFNEFFKFHTELRNRFRFNYTSLATRLYAGAVLPVAGNYGAPLSETFYISGLNSIRAFYPRSIGPGEFHSDKYSAYMYHSGDLKLEANIEYRFPLVWMLEGAVFVDAGNVWNLQSVRDYLTPEQLAELSKYTGIDYYNFDDGIKFNKLLNQIALGSGFGVRFVYQSIVVRLDVGIAIHAPYNTGKIGYYNIPNFFKDGVRLNFGIGYPF